MQRLYILTVLDYSQNTHNRYAISADSEGEARNIYERDWRDDISDRVQAVRFVCTTPDQVNNEI